MPSTEAAKKSTLFINAEWILWVKLHTAVGALMWPEHRVAMHANSGLGQSPRRQESSSSWESAEMSGRSHTPQNRELAGV